MPEQVWGETLTPGKWEELAASKACHRAPWLCPLQKGGLRAAPGLRRSRSLWAFAVFGFWRRRKQISPAHEEVPGGTVLCGTCFSSDSTFRRLPRCVPSSQGHFCCSVICRKSPPLEGGCLLKSHSRENCWFLSNLQDAAKFEMLRVFCNLPVNSSSSPFPSRAQSVAAEMG